MKLAYFDCQSGISGDMTLGALLDLDVPLVLLNEALRSVLENVRIETELVVRKGFRAKLATVVAPHEHAHRHLSDILKMIEKGSFSEENKERASDIFRLLAEAEAKVHGTDIEKVHFHEVGAVDSIADIVASVIGLDHLGVTEFRASAVPTGCGTIQIAHGTCSVPAPATAELLQGIPIAASNVPFELTTPTGAAILKYYVKQFGPIPSMMIRAIGVGAGGRDLEEQPNILRILIGETSDSGTKSLRAAVDYTTEHPHEHSHERRHEHVHTHGHGDPFPTALPIPVPNASITETAWIVETNLDDLSGEIIGHCVERLWTLSPLDVWCTPIQMKKHRPGVTLTVLCRREQIEAVEALLFAETTTIGIRRWPVERTVLHREACQLNTPWGLLDAKRAVLPDGKEKIALEFESVKRLAAERGLSVREILDGVRE